MSQSTSERVVCVLVTRDRAAMTHQAIACFRAQSYADKKLLILDSSVHVDPTFPYGQHDATTVWMPDMNGKTIGELRNAANWCAADWGHADIIAHFDSDDFSGPNRIAEQVSLLQSSSGADCVGYREMLFWREAPAFPPYTQEQLGAFGRGEPGGEAWLYSCPKQDYALGTSLCYWRKTWERKPFEATSQGEEERWLRGLKVVSGSRLGHPARSIGPGSVHYTDDAPRMIARIHPGNTSTAYAPHKMEAEARKKDGYWKRVPEWDSFCAESMR